MISAGVMLILLATARFAVDTANVFEAFIKHDPRTARVGYLADVTQPLFTTKHSILVAVLLVGDSFVVRRAPDALSRGNGVVLNHGRVQNYRCWVVWGKNIWIVLFPIALSFTSAGTEQLHAPDNVEQVLRLMYGCHSVRLVHDVGVQQPPKPDRPLRSSLAESFLLAQLGRERVLDMYAPFIPIRLYSTLTATM